LTYIFAADSIGLSLLLFTQLSLEFEPFESKTASTKTEFFVNSHSSAVTGQQRVVKLRGAALKNDPTPKM